MNINTQLKDDRNQKQIERIPLIETHNLGVYYDNAQRDDFISRVHGLFSKERKTQTPFWALKDLSFTAYSGDILGIVGSNGAGKSTLCRTIAGLLRPNEGELKVNGTVSALLSLGTGFNSDLTGNENIMLNGLLIGLSQTAVKELIPKIQEFSGLGHFLDQPLKHYSSGMRARLAFSIASAIEAEILVIDEVLSTGDLEFNRRAVKRVWELVSGASTVLIVTHDIEFVSKNCTRAIWIDNGQVKADDSPDEVVFLFKNYAIGKNKPRKKRIININHTMSEAGQHEVIKADKLGVSFNVNKKQFWALRNISFSIYEKEIIGIIGPNGAGKSTLCRALCNIYRHEEGVLDIKGQVAALLSFGTGFNPQLSGRDNIYLNGMMLGIPSQTIKVLENEIIEFAELEDAIHKPVKYYSKGMRSRLGFSIAAMLKPDIFIVDEALSAGDIAFQEKAASRMQEMIEDARAVLIVTHSMAIVERVCTRVLYLRKGILVFDGNPREAVKLYKKHSG